MLSHGMSSQANMPTSRLSSPAAMPGAAKRARYITCTWPMRLTS